MEQTVIIQLIISLLGLAGFFLANYIRRQKSHGEALVCPIGTSCTRVVNSEHSTLLGIRIELIGMVYYGLIAVLYAGMVFVPALATDWVVAFVLGATVSAFVFSMYLTGLQAFVLKEWCTWCLISMGICTTIFFCALTLWGVV